MYDSLYPKKAVSFESVKRAYGRDLKRNVEQGWKLDKKETHLRILEPAIREPGSARRIFFLMVV